MDMFLWWQNDKFWRQVWYVQANIKAKIGIGKPIYLKFYANLDDPDAENLVNYNLNDFESEA